VKHRRLLVLAGVMGAVAARHLAERCRGKQRQARPARNQAAAHRGPQGFRTPPRSRRSTEARRSRSSATRSATVTWRDLAPREALHEGHWNQGQRDSRTRPHRTRRTRSSRGAFSSKSSLDRRGDDRRRLAGRLRAVSSSNLKPKLGKQSKLHAAGIVQNDTIGGKARGDAMVRRLRDPLLPPPTC